MQLIQSIKNRISSVKDTAVMAVQAAETQQYWNSIAWNISPSTIEEFSSYILIDRRVYIRTILAGVPPLQELAGYPKNLNPRFIDEMLELSVEGFGIGYSLTVIPIETLESFSLLEKADFITKTAIESFKDHPKDGRTPDPTKQAPAKKFFEQEDLFENQRAIYDNDEKMFHTALIITLRGESVEQLNDAENHVRLILSGNRIHFEVPDYMHQKMYLATQPYPTWEKKSWIQLFSDHTARLLPTRNPNSKTDDEGLIIGSDLKTNRLIQLNLSKIIAPHFLIVGRTGSGKTYAAFLMLIRAHNQFGTRIIGITPKRDEGTNHRNLVKYFKGTIIDLGDTPGAHTLNPMEIFFDKGLRESSPEEVRQRYYDHLNVLIKFFGELLLSNVNQKQNMESYLIRTISEVYRKHGIDKSDISTWKNWPVLSDMYDVWARDAADKSNATAKALLNKSEMIKEQWSYLNKQSDIDLTSNFIYFDTSAMYSSTDNLQNAYNILIVALMGMRFNTKDEIPTIIACDEASVFLRNETLALFILRVLTQGRSQKISLWLLTQQTGDLQKAGVMEEFKTNIAVTIYMGNMKADSIKHVAEYGKMSESTQELLLQCGQGEAIVTYGDQTIPVKFEATELEHSIIKGITAPQIAPTDCCYELVHEGLRSLVEEHKICFKSWLKSDPEHLRKLGYTSYGVQRVTEPKVQQAWIKNVQNGMIGNETIDHYTTLLDLAGSLVIRGVTDIRINHNSDVDIVANINGQTIAFEYERPRTHTVDEIFIKKQNAEKQYGRCVFICQKANYDQVCQAVGKQNTIMRGIELKKYLDKLFAPDPATALI